MLIPGKFLYALGPFLCHDPKYSFEFLNSLSIWPVLQNVRSKLSKFFIYNSYMKPSNHNKDLAVSSKVKIVNHDHI